MAQIHAVILRNSYCENTAALITAECDPEMIQGVNDLYGAITMAVTRWVKGSDAGKQLWRDTNYDLNIGDLATSNIKHLDEKLVQELRAQGIQEIMIDCRVGETTNWAFDTILHDESYLEAE